MHPRRSVHLGKKFISIDRLRVDFGQGLRHAGVLLDHPFINLDRDQRRLPRLSFSRTHQLLVLAPFIDALREALTIQPFSLSRYYLCHKLSGNDDRLG